MIAKLPIVCLGAIEPNGYCSVRIRMTLKKRVDLYTGITVKPEQWDYTRRRVKQGCKVRGASYAYLNKLIQERSDFVQNYYDESLKPDQPAATPEDLKSRYHARFMRSEEEQSNEFYYLFEDYIEKRNRSKHWSISYYKEWIRICKDMKTFAPTLTFLTLSDIFMQSYIEHLAERMNDDKIENYLKKIREFIKNAKRTGHEINSSFYYFEPQLTERKKKVNYLENDEVQRIINLDYSSQPYLERVRDVFIFQCFTSLRFSDVSKLKRENFKLDEKGEYELNLITQKDKGQIWFPLCQIAKDIYNKYKDNVYDDDKAFYVCSYQDFHKFLKRIGKDADIKGSITTTTYRLGKTKTTVRNRCDIGTHDARRTFISICFSAGFSTEQIAYFTSHSEAEEMKPYIAVTEQGKKKIVNTLDSYFSNNGNNSLHPDQHS